MPVNDRTVGVMPGQPGVLGVNYTATFGKSMMSDRRLMYVDPDHADATDNGNTGENPEQPFLTIAAALARTRNDRGDVIFVGQNDYWQWSTQTQTPIAEEVTISKNGVSLIGTNSGAMGVPWNPVTAAGAGTCITVTACDVKIAGFNFFADTALGGTAISIDWDGTATFGDNTEISYCQFNEDVTTGITMDGTYYNEIHHCWFQDVIDDAIVGTSTESIHIHDCTFIDNGIGNGAAIALPTTVHTNIHHNYIYNHEARAAAASSNEGVNLTGGSQNQVCGNWFSCVLADGVVAGDWGLFNTGEATDSWAGNWCWDGMAITTPSNA